MIYDDTVVRYALLTDLFIPSIGSFFKYGSGSFVGGERKRKRRGKGKRKDTINHTPDRRVMTDDVAPQKSRDVKKSEHQLKIQRFSIISG